METWLKRILPPIAKNSSKDSYPFPFPIPSPPPWVVDPAPNFRVPPFVLPRAAWLGNCAVVLGARDPRKRPLRQRPTVGRWKVWPRGLEVWSLKHVFQLRNTRKRYNKWSKYILNYPDRYRYGWKMVKVMPSVLFSNVTAVRTVMPKAFHLVPNVSAAPIQAS